MERLYVRIIEEPREPAGRLEVLVVPVGSQSLPALLAVPDSQRLSIDRLGDAARGGLIAGAHDTFWPVSRRHVAGSSGVRESLEAET
jgi:hypothetical protein